MVVRMVSSFCGLLSGNYNGTGEVTQHFFYAGIVLVPLALVGAFNARALRMALLLGLPFLWYALGPAAGLFRVIARLPGFMGIGHTRYPTVGDGTADDAQPLYTNAPHGIAMAHNGNVTNYVELKRDLGKRDGRRLGTNCDVEVILKTELEFQIGSALKFVENNSIINPLDPCLVSIAIVR